MGSRAAIKKIKKDLDKQKNFDADSTGKKQASKKTKAKRLSPEELEQVILETREFGQKLAWRFLNRWRVRLQQDEIDSSVYLALCEAGLRFDPSKGVNFKTFFFYHLRGQLLKDIVKSMKDQKVSQPLPDGDYALNTSMALPNVWPFKLVDTQTPEADFSKRETARACWEACSELDELEQEVVIRHFIYDQSLVSVAEELDYCRCHISRVKSRALKKLEKMLDHNAEDQESTARAKRTPATRRSYTGGRGRRSLNTEKKKSASLEKLLANM